MRDRGGLRFDDIPRRQVEQPSCHGRRMGPARWRGDTLRATASRGAPMRGGGGDARGAREEGRVAARNFGSVAGCARALGSAAALASRPARTSRCSAAVFLAAYARRRALSDFVARALHDVARCGLHGIGFAPSAWSKTTGLVPDAERRAGNSSRCPRHDTAGASRRTRKRKGTRQRVPTATPPTSKAVIRAMTPAVGRRFFWSESGLVTRA